MRQSDSIKELSGALAKAFSELTAVPMNATNPFFHSRYADLGSVISASKPVLSKYGLAIIQAPTSSENGIGVCTRLQHSSGEYMEQDFVVPLTLGGRSIAQEAGAIITYLRRYAWSAMLGLYSEEDTDSEPPVQRAQPQVHSTGVTSVLGAEVVRTVLAEGLFENTPNATSVLARFTPRTDTLENIVAKAKIYRDWRENGAETEYALEKANAMQEHQGE